MLNYRRQGEGPTLVLQHGFLGGSNYFVPQIRHFSRSYDVIAADLPGFAGSGSLPYPGTVTGLSAALIDLLDSLGVGHFALLGHSLGGVVALQSALDHGDRIEKLILYSTSSRGAMPHRHEPFENTIAKLEADGVEKTAARIAATWFVDGEQAPNYPLCLEAGRGASLEATIACLRNLPEWEVTARLGSLAMPTLVVCGDQDRSYGLAEMRAMAENIVDAKLIVIPGCAHNVHLEETALFNKTVESFLTGSAQG